MPIQSVVGRSIAIRRQTGLGAIGVNDAQARVIPFLDGTNLSLQKTAITSEEVTPTFQMQTARHGNRGVSGEIQGHLQCGTYSQLMEAAVRRDFVALSPLAALTNVTAASTGANTGTFTRGAGSWISDGLRVGMVVRMTGWTTTGASNNNRMYAITALTATVMTVAGVVAAKTAGDSVVVSVPGRVTFMPGSFHTSPYFTVEEWNPDVPQSFRFVDCRVNTMSMNLTPNAAVGLSFGLIGRDRSKASTRLLSNATVAAQSVMQVGHQGLLVVNGTPQGIVTACEINLTNNAEPGPVVGSNVPADVFYGRMMVTGRLSVYFDNMTLDDAFDAENTVSLIVQTTDSADPTSNVLQFTLPRILPSGGSYSTATQSRVQTLEFTALRSEGFSGNEATTLMVQDTSLT